MNYFFKVCCGKFNNWFKFLYLKKLLKGKYYVRFVDVEEFLSSEMLFLVGVDSDNSEEYIFNIGVQGY